MTIPNRGGEGAPADHPEPRTNLRTVSGGIWTLDGRWVVLGGDGSIAFDPVALYDADADSALLELMGRRFAGHHDRQIKACHLFVAGKI